VVPARRRTGLGGRLLARTEGEAAARGAVTLYLEVAETNRSARALYARAGYAVVGRRPGYYRVGNEVRDALIMSKPLGV